MGFSSGAAQSSRDVAIKTRASITAARPLTAEGFQRETGVSRETLARLEVYAALLRRWNRAINLVLAMLGAGETHLIEANRRKATFLGEVARETETEVAVHAKRIETLRPFAADVVTARALAPLSALLDYAAPFLDRDPERRGRCLFLKGKRADQELTAAENRWSMTTLRVESRSDPTGIILNIEICGGDITRS